ncbi:RTX toxin [Oceanicola sp. 22II-s10i]|uniref:HlyD family type I secretion periplasmic adaptor subunit n=1 Tax=Oceanicola sp. 22II-s10i TaxID=1317116 RepID=UPI000B528D9D|nr:HlyD family type I secretion periplasmic adaptor subunit [Oceanicola sp. 22II-s10i]OWU86350.1 RTX toxin [Oceanicola sp. 22II-s10i]
MTGRDSTNRWSASSPMAIGLLALFALIGGFGTWAATSELSGAVIAMGRIEVDKNRQVVQHPDGGVIEEVLVEEGQFVEADQVLVRLEAAPLRSELAVVEGQLFELMARRGRLEAEQNGDDAITFDNMLVEVAQTREEARKLMDGQNSLFDARLKSKQSEIDQLGKRREQISSQIGGYDAQIAAIGTQLELIEEELTSQRSLLDRGLAQAARVLALQREEARLRGTLGEVQSARAQSEGRITEIDLAILQIDTTRREEAISQLRELQYRELSQLENRRALLTRIERLDITAPVSGIVYGLQVSARRSVVQPAQQLLYVVPQDRPLIIAAQVDPISIDQIYVGQEAILRFSAFTQRDMPDFYGSVTLVSADAFTDESRLRSFYEIEIRLAEGELDKLQPDQHLLPGMPVEAYVRTGEQSPLDYLIKPMADYFRRAFRES